MSLTPIDIVGLCLGGGAVLGAIFSAVYILVDLHTPSAPSEETDEAPQPAPARVRIRAFQIVPKSEAHTLPRFLRKH